MISGKHEVKLLLPQTAQNVCIRLMDGPGVELKKDGQSAWTA